MATKPSTPRNPYGTTTPAVIDVGFLNAIGQVVGPILDTHAHGPNDYGGTILPAYLPSDPTHPQLPLTTDTTGLGVDADFAMLKGAIGALINSGDSTTDFRQVASIGALAVLNPTSFSSTAGTINNHGGGAITAGTNKQVDLVTPATWPVGNIVVGTQLVIDTVASGVQEKVRVTAVQTSGANITGFTVASFVNGHAAGVGYTVAIQTGSIALSSGDAVEAGQHISTVESGTPPMTVLSDTTVSGMSVEMINNMRASETYGADLFNDPSYVSGSPYVIAANGNGLHDATAVDFDAVESQDWVEYTPGNSSLPDSLANIRAILAAHSTAGGLSGFWYDSVTALVTNMTVNGVGFPPGPLDLTFGPGLNTAVTGHALTAWPKVQGLSVNGVAMPDGAYNLQSGVGMTIQVSGTAIVLSSSGGSGGGGSGLTDTGLVLTGGGTHVPLTLSPAAVFSHLFMTPKLTAGPPTSGSHSIGEWNFDVNGDVWICSVSGIPGTWNALSWQRELVYVVAASGAAVTIPAPAEESISDVTLTAGCSIGFPAAAAGDSFTLVLRQDSSGGRTVVWPGNVKWAGGAPPALSTAGNAVDLFTFTCTDGANFLGVNAGKAFS